ncbi:kinase-like domain-containing protein, partial [Mycena leptocephala]
EQFVSKRFFRLSDVPGPVSVKDNAVEIKAELTRLAWGGWFLDNFYQFCNEGELSDKVDTDAFLAQEVDMPSVASGVSIITEEDTGLMWLVERRRPVSVTKFSGTLVHTSARRDLRSLTISAFAHFVFGYSDRQMVFADLQGTPSRVKGGDGLVLFDLMTHTLLGSSGVSDFGKEGIDTFIQDHECNAVCFGLQL